MPDEIPDENPASEDQPDNDNLIDALESLNILIEDSDAEDPDDGPSLAEDGVPLFGDPGDEYTIDALNDNIPVLKDIINRDEFQLDLYAGEEHALSDEFLSAIRHELANKLSGIVKQAVNEAFEIAIKQASIRAESSIRVHLETELLKLIEKIARQHARNQGKGTSD